MTEPVEIIGVYAVEGAEACHLVEMIVRCDTMPDFGDFTQPVTERPRSDWQVPYDERLLTADGDGELVDLFIDRPTTWPLPARVAFFFHELNPDRPLVTPFGEVDLPRPSVRPNRLAWLQYEAP